MKLNRRKKNKTITRLVRHRRVRAKLAGDAARPRLTVFRSAKHIYAQIVDDRAGRTLAAANDLQLKTKKAAGKSGQATAVGETLAKSAVAKKIKQVRFDRGGYRYAGRVKALADAARAGGLEF